MNIKTLKDKIFSISLNRKKAVFSVFLSFLFAILLMVSSGCNLPINTQKDLLYLFNLLSEGSAKKEANDAFLRDSLLLIDVQYDKVMALKMASKNVADGYVAITDRLLLKEFLDSLNSRKDYKYIILDIFFEKSVRQSGDTALFNLISSMDNIVIPYPENGELADPCLQNKAGEVKYRVPFWETDFVKYPYFLDGAKSIATRMYEDITKSKINTFGPFYIEKGIVRSSAILTFDLLDDSFYHSYLSDVLGKNPIHKNTTSMFSEYKDYTKDKYILIGDFANDRHITYTGEMSGTMINFNAFLAMKNGHHRYSIIAFLVLWIVFFYYSYQILTRASTSSWFVFRYPFVLTVICFFCYMFNEIYDVFVGSIILYLLRVCVDAYYYFKHIITLKRNK